MQTRSLLLSMETETLHRDNMRNAPSDHFGRLVYAKPQDLPSFPSLGLKTNGSAASAAASLGWAKKKSPELWKPDKSASASAAAVLVKDHKMAAVWTPSASSHGTQAALLAHKASRSVDSWKPSASVNGQLAATQAFKSNRNATYESRAPTLDRQRSLMAARGAMATRPKAKSTPDSKDSYPDETNAAANALKAATKAHNPKRTSISIKDTGAVSYTNMSRQMFTSHPPVKQAEVPKQTREEELHASAVAMAKKMFSQQQVLIERAKKSHASVQPSRARRRSSSSMSDDIQPMQFNTLQDAAYKLAQERLAKLHEDNLKNRDLQDYYGQSKSQRKFSVRGKLRRRASSDGVVIEDRRKSNRIRKQMSIFSTKLSEVDDKKRQEDRDALLAAAQRNVDARLRGMDEQVAEKTGMISPSTFIQWDTKAYSSAQAHAQIRSDNRLSNHGKIDIGAGKYMEQEDIDAIARKRVRPVLDEINVKAEKEHARQIELRLEVERKKEVEKIEKAREQEVQDIYERLKEQEKLEVKQKKIEEKQEARAKKEEDKAAKRLAKVSKRKSAPAIAQHSATDEEPADADAATALNDVGQPVQDSRPGVPQTLSGTQGSFKVQIPEEHKMGHRARSASSTPRSPTEKVKMWFRSRFSRGSNPDDEKTKDKNGKSFVGGAALTGTDENSNSTTSVDNGSASMSAIAMAGRRRIDDSEGTQGDVNDVSPLSSSSEDEYFHVEGRDHNGTSLSAPHSMRDPASRKSQSPVRDSRFHEII